MTEREPYHRMQINVPRRVWAAAQRRHHSGNPTREVSKTVKRLLEVEYLATQGELPVEVVDKATPELSAESSQVAERWGYPPPSAPPAELHHPPFYLWGMGDPWAAVPQQQQAEPERPPEPIAQTERSRWRSSRPTACSNCGSAIHQGDPILEYRQWWSSRHVWASRIADQKCGIIIEHLAVQP